jgi:hypothetical protein
MWRSEERNHSSTIVAVIVVLLILVIPNGRFFDDCIFAKTIGNPSWSKLWCFYLSASWHFASLAKRQRLTTTTFNITSWPYNGTVIKDGIRIVKLRMTEYYCFSPRESECLIHKLVKFFLSMKYDQNSKQRERPKACPIPDQHCIKAILPDQWTE